VVSVRKATTVCWDRPLLLLFKSLTILFLEIISEEISVQLVIIVLQAPLMLIVVHLEPIIMWLVKVTVSLVLQATFVLLKRLIIVEVCMTVQSAIIARMELNMQHSFLVLQELSII